MNHILESFGNARTICNDKSSRFKKFVDIRIKTYLLEKFWLIHPRVGERNYQFFYHFFMDGRGAKDFKLLNQSGVFNRRGGVSDKSNH